MNYCGVLLLGYFSINFIWVLYILIKLRKQEENEKTNKT